MLANSQSFQELPLAKQIIPVILCGGAGTRLWPVSRESMPKQFVPLVGTRSTFQQVLERVSDRELFGPALIVTHSDFRFIAAEQCRALGAEAEIVIEPTRRDSGPAIAAATSLVALRDPSAAIVVLAADHVMTKPDAFIAACADALPAVEAGYIVTFGIRPSFPSTAYGYIRPGKTLTAAHMVDAFVEKPDAATAERYVREGYLWNSGNFMFRADTLLAEIAALAPDMAKAAAAAAAEATKDLDFLRLAEAPFATAPKKSIDYAVMEHTKRAAVIAVDFGWSDIGSWDSVWAATTRDAQGNAITGTAELIDTRNTLVHSDGSQIITAIGCDALVIIATADAILVVPRDQSERVKAVVELLKQKQYKEATEHRRIFRPWGFYQGVDVGDRYQVKRIVVKPQGKLSLQKHAHRSEHWVVVKGTAEVTVADKVQTVHENESIYIPIGSKHRLANPGRIPLELIEVQVGSYLGEDDIIRFDDVYRRE
jgi:mannose-1-phosphate guanylyltransferase/mannose-6-phosphate isomerase